MLEGSVLRDAEGEAGGFAELCLEAFELGFSERGVGDVIEYARVYESLDGAFHVLFFEASVAARDATEDVCDLIYLLGKGGDGDVAGTVVLKSDA